MKTKMKWIGLCLSLVLVISTGADGYYGKALCDNPDYKCIQVQTDDTWARLFPNLRDREIVKRLNRMNIELRYRDWIVVPKNLEQTSLMDISPLAQHKDTGGKKLIYVSLSKAAFGAYDASGDLIFWGPVSAGKDYCASIHAPCKTVTGSFRIYRMQGPDCVSSEYPVATHGGAPMPYCMHFYRGYVIHGSVLPGYRSSHGCLRVFFEDAKWLNEHFVKIGTKVRIVA